jgi:phage portal protein BeeE
MFAAQRSANTGTSYMGIFFFGIRQQRYQYKKSLTLTAVYNAVEQISNDIAKYRFPLTKKTATTANQNPIIQHTSLFLFS